jgi:hypothetical protein
MSMLYWTVRETDAVTMRVFSSEALVFPCSCCTFETRDGIMYKKKDQFRRFSCFNSSTGIQSSIHSFLIQAKSGANSNLLGQGGL